MGHFSDPSSVARYAEGPRRLVPGLEALHRMTLLLLAERAPKDARVLVLGAGGGMELKVFAEGQPGWRFDGVDPAAAMLKLAEEMLGPLAAQVSLHEGYIDSAPGRTVRRGDLSAHPPLFEPGGTAAHVAGSATPDETGCPVRGRASQLSARRGRSRALVIPLCRVRGRIGRRPRNDGKPGAVSSPTNSRRCRPKRTRHRCARPASPM